MADPIVTALREAAVHRGYRLKVSRKKTPGTGDYGKFGLTDPKGKPVLGIGKEGLTASADDVEAYLRGGEIDTWKKSAALAPQLEKPKKATAKIPEDEAAAPAPRKAKPERASPPPSRPLAKIKAKPRRPRRPDPPPLRIRKADPADTNAIAKLLAPAANAARQRRAIAERIILTKKAGSGMLVAEQGAVIGCIAWTIVPALHRPPCGRIATLMVADRQRRQGIGRALVEAAANHLAKSGCETIEAMSDIDIRSAHGFFRRMGFAETSYRFARSVTPEEAA